MTSPQPLPASAASAAAPASAAQRSWQTPFFEHPLACLLLLALAHVVSRALISPGMKWDESEQILWSQELALGYGAQPPLYTWLQWLAVQVLGPSVLALAVVKHTVIALTYVLAWLAARELLSPRGAFWVAGGLLLMPPFGWHAVRDLTHTVLVTAMALGLCWGVLRMVKAPKASNYALVGLFCGLGMMAKYSFAMLIAAYVLACLTVPQARRALFQRGWWLAPLVGVLIFLPNLLWVLANWHEATVQTIEKMEISTQTSYWVGLGNLVEILAATLLLWAIVVGLAFRGQLRAPLPADAATRWPWRTWAWPLLSRFVLTVLLMLLAMVVMGDVNNFKQRWILPLVAGVPLLLFVWKPQLQDGAVRGGGIYTGAVLLFALIFFIMATVRPWWAARDGKSQQADELILPVPELAAQLRTVGYDGQGDIVAADHMLAAMLRSRYPNVRAMACDTVIKRKPVACVEEAVASAHAGGRGVLLVSRDRRDLPGETAWWQAVTASLSAKQGGELAIPSPYMSKNAAPIHFQYLWLPAAAAAPVAPVSPAPGNAAPAGGTR